MLIRHCVAVKISRSAIKRVNHGKMSPGEEKGGEHQQVRREDQCGQTLSAWAVMLQLRQKGKLRRLGVKLSKEKCTNILKLKPLNIQSMFWVLFNQS